MDDVPSGFDPACTRPDDLVRPVRVGRSGVEGLTWRRASGPGFERVGRGLYVPASRRRSVEQRIVDAAARLATDRTHGLVTGWAALRWQGASYFDGRTAHGGDEEPVELVVSGLTSLDSRPGVRVWRGCTGPREARMVAGLPVASVARALFDEIHTRNDLWSAVQAIDMTAAAGLISAWRFAEFLWPCTSRNGVPLARHAASLAVDESRSPRETWLRLVWRLVAGLDEPLVNQSIYTRDGRFIAKPDLLDPVAGLVGEYAGSVHDEPHQRRLDRGREDRRRDHGLVVVEVGRGESRRVAADRLRAGRRRAQFLPPDQRTWTTDRPDWDPAPETLDTYFERTGQVEDLIACDWGFLDGP